MDKNFKKDIERLQKTITNAATLTVDKVIKNRAAKHASFDEVEVIPYSTLNTGQITISQSTMDNSSLDLEVLLEQESNELIAQSLVDLEQSIKEVLK